MTVFLKARLICLLSHSVLSRTRWHLGLKFCKVEIMRFYGWKKVAFRKEEKKEASSLKNEVFLMNL